MRPNTLYVILLLLACLILSGLEWLASSYVIHLPLLGNVSLVIVAVIILPLVLVSVAAFNQRIIAWRKARGKDIVEELKHEFDDADIISLRPRQPHEHSSTYRRWDPDN